MSLNRILTGFRPVEIRQGDTLQSIAARELDDASKWALIAAINGLKPPYLTASAAEAGEAVKLYGQMLLVPAAVQQATSNTTPEVVFGIDLDLGSGELSAEDGDFALISGRANLKQALLNRVSTVWGELLFHLDYGCGARTLLGTVNGPTAGLLAAEYVKAAVLADPRISSIESAEAEVLGDQINTSVEAVPISGRPVDLSAVV